MSQIPILYPQQEKLLAQKIGKRPDQVPPVLMSLLRNSTAAALSESPLAPVFKRQGVSFRDAEEWLAAFARGAQYAHERYGSIFSHIQLCDTIHLRSGESDPVRCHYNQSTDCAVVTAGFICQHIKAYGRQRTGSGHQNTDGDHYSCHELALLGGFEEAFHAYQLKKRQHIYEYKPEPPVFGANASAQEIDRYYMNSPLERDARDAVIEAARELGLGNNGTSRILLP